MKDDLLPPNHENGIRLKELPGWFVAGEGFRRALSLLSDGAFKLFAYLSLHADRRTGCLAATQKELAAALGKSKRILGTYAAELEAKEVCKVRAGKNQFCATIYEISDSYWPYHRTGSRPESPEIEAYVESVRECFEGLGCTSGTFGAAGIEAAPAAPPASNSCRHGSRCYAFGSVPQNRFMAEWRASRAHPKHGLFYSIDRRNPGEAISCRLLDTSAQSAPTTVRDVEQIGS